MAPSTDFHLEASSASTSSGEFVPETPSPVFPESGGMGKLQRFVIPLEKQDVLMDFSLCDEGGHAFAWSDPSGRLEFVASGEIECIETTGAERFEQAEKWCSGIFEQLGDRAPELPCVVGGFAFSTSPFRYGAWWKRWPDGRFVLPERIVYRRRLADGSLEAGLIIHRRSRGYGEEDLKPAEIQRAFVRRVEALRSGGSQSPCARVQDSSGRFEGLVRQALRSIEQGELTKVVVARATQLEPPPGHQINVNSTIRRICGGDEHVIGFSLRLPGGDAFVGRTPEVLVRVEKGRFSTHAMAGTIERGRTSAEDEALGRKLLSSTKERHEHDLVVQGVEAALRPISKGLSFTDEPEILRLETVQHLSTAFSGTLAARCSALHAVARLHPTPALCGSPNASARRWIAEHEPMERGWYAGPIGWIAPSGAGTFAVAIRSALLRGSGAVAFGGAGIVEGSDPAMEWRETEMKIDAVARHILTEEVEG